MSSVLNVVKLNEHRGFVKADVNNGFDRTAGQINDYLAKAGLPGREYQIVFAVIAKTYRYHKKMDWISLSQFEEMTGIASANISRLKTSLLNKKILVCKGQKIGINNILSEWKLEKRKSNAQKKPLKTTNKPLRTTNNSVSQERLEVSQERLAKPLRTTNILVKDDVHNRKTTNTIDYITKDQGKKPHQLDTNCISSNLPKASVLEFIEHRKQMKKPMTQLALTKLINLLDGHQKNGFDIQKVIDAAICNGWQSVHPKPEHKAQTNSKLGSVGQSVANTMAGMNFDE